MAPKRCTRLLVRIAAQQEHRSINAALHCTLTIIMTPLAGLRVEWIVHVWPFLLARRQDARFTSFFRGQSMPMQSTVSFCTTVDVQLYVIVLLLLLFFLCMFLRNWAEFERVQRNGTLSEPSERVRSSRNSKETRPSMGDGGRP
jgi:hypothetical protein